MAKEIPLTKGKVAIVDDADYEMLVGMGKWQYHAKGYEDEKEAARAYNEAASSIFGEFACLNQI